MTSRLAALSALALAGAALAVAIVVAVQGFPRGLPVVACVAAAVAVAWRGIARLGRERDLHLAAAALLLVGAAVLTTVNDRLVENAIVIGCAVASVAAARAAFTVHAVWPSAPRPEHAVLIWNPRSGGGKATRFHLDDEARARGIEPVELKPGDDLEALVEGALDRGADALAAAGGDGTQAIVARMAADRGLPYACIPAGTRNHFALDLGVDRDDVVGALDALVDGGERRVDLAEVNGRVFVNNVSLGVYADAVQKAGYREAKIRTILDTYGQNGDDKAALHWDGPDGREDRAAPALLVSNNAYRLGSAIGSGTRPRVDAGVLGITVFDGPGAERRQPWRSWTAPRFEVGAEQPVNAGIDGEAAVLAPPLEFVSHPGVLRVRIARQHPGASPSAAVPDGAWARVHALAAIAAGHER
jgi:diacylglycerol kinase family enzyme